MSREQLISDQVTRNTSSPCGGFPSVVVMIWADTCTMDTRSHEATRSNLIATIVTLACRVETGPIEITDMDLPDTHFTDNYSPTLELIDARIGPYQT